MDVLHGAHVHAAGGLGHDDDIGVFAEYPGDDHLLLVAAGQGAAPLLHVGGLDGKLGALLLGKLADGGGQPQAAAGEGGAAVVAKDEVVLNAHLQHQAAGHAVFGHMAHAGGQEGGGVSTEGLAVLEQLHMVGAAQAGKNLDELGLAVALDAGDAQNLPLA